MQQRSESSEYVVRLPSQLGLTGESQNQDYILTHLAEIFNQTLQYYHTKAILQNQNDFKSQVSLAEQFIKDVNEMFHLKLQKLRDQQSINSMVGLGTLGANYNPIICPDQSNNQNAGGIRMQIDTTSLNSHLVQRDSQVFEQTMNGSVNSGHKYNRKSRQDSFQTRGGEEQQQQTHGQRVSQVSHNSKDISKSRLSSSNTSNTNGKRANKCVKRNSRASSTLVKKDPSKKKDKIQQLLQEKEHTYQSKMEKIYEESQEGSSQHSGSDNYDSESDSDLSIYDDDSYKE